VLQTISNPRQGDLGATQSKKDMAPAPLTTVTGIVETVNDNGIKLQNGNWINYSTYGYKGPRGGQPAPQIGETITAQLKNDKFIHTLVMGSHSPLTTTPPAQTQPQPVPAPSAVIHMAPPGEHSFLTGDAARQKFIDTTIKVRLEILKTMSVSQAEMFTLEKVEELTEIVRNLEQFVLEDMIVPSSDDEADLTADDLTEDI
jgi:hypothetical protein